MKRGTGTSPSVLVQNTLCRVDVPTDRIISILRTVDEVLLEPVSVNDEFTVNYATKV